MIHTIYIVKLVVFFAIGFLQALSFRAAVWLAARIAIPVVENLKKTENAARRAITTTKLHRCTGDTGTGPRWNGCCRQKASFKVGK